jgi:hypothetical protein
MRKTLKQRHGRGWMAPHSGCAGCGLSQGICAELGVGRCQYRDLAIPISWGVYRNAKWEGLRERLEEADIDDEMTWMVWLGQKRMVFGEEGNEMVRVTEAVLQDLVREHTTATL